MARRVNPTAIGAFVVGSIAIILVAAVIFGSGRLFRKPHQFVSFFQGSLNGLKVGAPVKFRGVEIGSVTRISIQLRPSEGRVSGQEAAVTALPVVFEVDETQLQARGGTGAALRGQGALQQLIKEGLRAQLQSESILTGVLYIDLGIYPKTQANFMLVPGTSEYREIPTIPTDFEEVQASAMRALSKLEKVDFVGMTNSITEMTTSIREVMASSDTRDTLRNLNKAVVSLRQTLETANAKIDPLVANLEQTSDEAEATLKETRATVAELHAVLKPGSPLSYQINKALDDVAGASRAVRELADYLQRNPAAVVRGRYTSDGKQ